jgi:hypothetical protein
MHEMKVIFFKMVVLPVTMLPTYSIYHNSPPSLFAVWQDRQHVIVTDESHVHRVYILMDLRIVLFELVVVSHLKIKTLHWIKHIKLTMKLTVSARFLIFSVLSPEEYFILTLIFRQAFVTKALTISPTSQKAKYHNIIVFICFRFIWRHYQYLRLLYSGSPSLVQRVVTIKVYKFRFSVSRATCCHNQSL